MKPISFNWQNGGGYGNANEGLAVSEDHTGPLSRSQTLAVAQPVAMTHSVDMGGNKGLNGGGILKELTQPLGTNGAHAISTAMQVRRLTPVECERLQGFPDGYTAIPWRNKPADQCPDGPRYKALGNSMAVPVMRWIGQQLDKVK